MSATLESSEIDANASNCPRATPLRVVPIAVLEGVLLMHPVDVERTSPFARQRSRRWRGTRVKYSEYIYDCQACYSLARNYVKPALAIRLAALSVSRRKKSTKAMCC